VRVKSPAIPEGTFLHLQYLDGGIDVNVIDDEGDVLDNLDSIQSDLRACGGNGIIHIMDDVVVPFHLLPAIREAVHGTKENPCEEQDIDDEDSVPVATNLVTGVHFELESGGSKADIPVTAQVAAIATDEHGTQYPINTEIEMIVEAALQETGTPDGANVVVRCNPNLVQSSTGSEGCPTNSITRCCIVFSVALHAAEPLQPAALLNSVNVCTCVTLSNHLLMVGGSLFDYSRLTLPRSEIDRLASMQVEVPVQVKVIVQNENCDMDFDNLTINAPVEVEVGVDLVVNGHKVGHGQKEMGMACDGIAQEWKACRHTNKRTGYKLVKSCEGDNLCVMKNKHYAQCVPKGAISRLVNKKGWDGTVLECE
jgi:hypothetical protein